MTTLDVFLQETHIATLESTRRGARLLFDDSVQRQYLGQPLLSMSLLVKKKPFGEGLTNAWFENLLPEGERLDRLCRQLQCQTSDYVRILEHVGWECAGAVSIIRPNSPDSEDIFAKNHHDLKGDAHHKNTLSQRQLKDRLTNLVPYEIEESLIARVSLGGFQEKLLLSAQPQEIKIKNGYISKAKFQLPEGDAPSTHILKPQFAQKYPHLIAAEAWAMTVAGAAARCAKAALLDIEGAPLTLVVERFDRVYRSACASETARDKKKAEIVRLHQEDCCQALGLPPLMKYAAAKQPKGSDPTYVRIAELLMTYGAHATRELCELLTQMVVNLVLGNLDAHAKNYSFLYEIPCSPVLSPMYDITPVQDLEPNARHLSMRINGEIVADKIKRDDVIDEAVSWGLPRVLAIQTLDETLERLREGLNLAATCYPDTNKQFASATKKRLGHLLH